MTYVAYAQTLWMIRLCSEIWQHHGHTRSSFFTSFTLISVQWP